MLQRRVYRVGLRLLAIVQEWATEIVALLFRTRGRTKVCRIWIPDIGLATPRVKGRVAGSIGSWARHWPSKRLLLLLSLSWRRGGQSLSMLVVPWRDGWPPSIRVRWNMVVWPVALQSASISDTTSSQILLMVGAGRVDGHV